MSQYRSQTVEMLVPPIDLHDDNPAVVRVPNQGRTALDRGDMSYASWLACCHTPIGATVNILVRE